MTKCQSDGLKALIQVPAEGDDIFPWELEAVGERLMADSPVIAIDTLHQLRVFLEGIADLGMDKQIQQQGQQQVRERQGDAEVRYLLKENLVHHILLLIVMEQIPGKSGGLFPEQQLKGFFRECG